jgi:spore germination protein YaaH
VAYLPPDELGSRASLTYTPVRNQNGTATVTVTVRDAGFDGLLGNADDLTFPRMFTVTVNSENDPPTATSDTKSTAEDTALSFTASTLTSNDLAGPANESSQALTITAVSNSSTQGGSVSLSGSTIIYTPAPNFFGTDTFTYTVSDNGTTNGSPDPKTATATASVTVTAFNDAPTPTADTKSTAEDTALSFAASTLTSNDLAGPADESSQALAVTAVSNSSTQGGSVSLSGSTITYTPAPNFFGTDTFTYTVSDNGTTNGSADPKTATGTVTVTVNPVNDSPTLTAIATPLPINEDALTQTINLSGIMAGSGESQTLTVTATSDTPALIPTPTVSYTSPNATGSLSFTRWPTRVVRPPSRSPSRTTEAL